ncbi:MAG: MFS transporter [Erysipelotrichaceae bacterium]|nr:MFS transporter [Erysipelotrichaceae bacterium]
MAKKEKKPRSPEYVGFKEIFGSTALSTTSGLSAIFMSTMFMNYMTDYAGLGSWGATLATTLLLAARFIDAIDDPIQGVIMDGAKVTKHGKYKPFFLLSVIMTVVGSIALYSLPDAIVKTPWLVTVWVIFFYFVYDIGTSFYNQNLLFRTMTSDVEQRTKLLLGPRLWVMILGIMGSASTAIVVSIQAATGSFKTAYMILALAGMGIAGVVSILGWFMVTERHVVEQEEDEKVTISDFFEIIKTNKAMTVDFFKNIFHGFIWTLLFAAPTYYVKYAYCFDATTGTVDYAKLGTFSLIVSMMMLLPLLVGTAVATPILKAFKGDIIKMHKFDLTMQGIGGAVLFGGQLLGILQKVPAIFFAAMFIMATFIGIDFIPGSNIGMEIMDYTVYKTGKDRSALTSVFGTFLSKAQSALSSAIVGGLLMAIGYEVDSVTGNYVGELSRIPTMLTGMTVIIGLLPALCAVASVLILRKYPIDQEERAKMRAYIDEHQSKKVEE